MPLTFAVDRDGEYRASLHDGAGRPLRDRRRGGARARTRRERARAFVRAAPDDREYFDAAMRPTFLTRIAEDTGGRFYTPSTVVDAARGHHVPGPRRDGRAGEGPLGHARRPAAARRPRRRRVGAPAPMGAGVTRAGARLRSCWRRCSRSAPRQRRSPAAATCSSSSASAAISRTPSGSTSGRRRSSTRRAGATGCPPRASSTSARTRPATRSASAAARRARPSPRRSTAWRARPGPGDPVFIVLIGHGASATGGARFNLPGPDLTAAEFARTAGPIRRADGGLREHGELERRLRAGALGQEPDVITATTHRRRAQPDALRRVLRRGVLGRRGRRRQGRPRVDARGVHLGAHVAWPTRTSGTASCSPSTPCSTTTATARARAAPGQPGSGRRAGPHAVPVGRGRQPRRSPTRPIPELRALVAQRDALEARIATLKAAKDKTDPGRRTQRDLEQLLIDLARVNRGHSGEAEVMKTIVIGLARARGRGHRGRRRVAAGPGRSGCRRCRSAAAGGSAAAAPGGGMPPGRVRAGPRGHALRPARSARSRPTSTPGQLPYDGHFVFARLRYDAGRVARRARRRAVLRPARPRRPGAALVARLPARRAQLHEDPRRRSRRIDPYTGPLGGAIVDIGSPDLFKYPVSYMAEAGFWTQTDEEARTCAPTCSRAASSSSTTSAANDWANFEAQMKRVLPDVRMVELDARAPDLPLVLRHR